MKQKRRLKLSLKIERECCPSLTLPSCPDHILKNIQPRSCGVRSSRWGPSHGVPSTAGEWGTEEGQDQAPWILEAYWLNPSTASCLWMPASCLL